MATGQSKIYLDVEARLRGYESIQKLNEALNTTGKEADEATDALVKAGRATGTIPSARAQSRIETLAQSLDLLGKSGRLSAEEIEAAYQKSLASITRTGGTISAEALAARLGRESPAKVKADAEAAAKAEIDVARKTAEVKKAIGQENVDAAKRFAEQTRVIQQSAADYELSVAKFYQDQQVAVQKARADRIVQLESQANDRVLAIRERFDKVVSARPQLAEQLRKQDAIVPVGPIRESTRALAEQDRQLAKSGVTARQTAAAMRQLPAQFSDIVVSLQGGQAPLTVFLQQGAQIKDSFGGVGNAVRAFGSYLLGLVNPLSVAAAGMAAYTALVYKAQQEQLALARAVVFSGNAIGLSVGQLNDVAKAVAETTGTTVGAASKLVASLAQTGKIGADSIKQVADAAVLLEKNGGPALEETKNLMVSLAKDPQKGLQELAEKYGIVSLAIQNQVKELIELGRQEEAVAVAQRYTAEEFTKRAKSLEDSSGLLIRFFKGVGQAARDMWDSITNIGRTDTDFKLDEVYAQLNNAINTGATQAEIADLQKRFDALKALQDQRKKEAQAQGEATRAAKAASEAQERVNKSVSDGASKQEKLNKELEKYRNDIKLVNEQRAKEGLSPLAADQVAKGEAAIRERFKETAKATRNIVNTFKIESLEGKKQLLELESLAVERKRLYDQNLVDLDTFYNGQKTLIEEQAKLEQSNLAEQKARLEGEKAKADPNQKIRLDNEIAKIAFESTKYQLQASEKLAALEVERSRAIEKTRAELQNINQLYLNITNQGTSAEAVEARRRDIAQKYAVIVDQINTALSRRDVANADELLARRQQIEAIQAQELALQNLAAAQQENQATLTSNTVEQVQIQYELQRGLISQIEAEARLNELKRQALELQIATQQAAIDSGQIQGEALSKATIAVAELRAQLAQTTPTVQAFGDQFKVLFQDRIAGALGDVLTRTRSFKDAFRSLLAGIAQDIIRSNITKLIGAAFGGGIGAGATGNLPGVVLGGPAFAEGGKISGPGTGTSDSVPIMASNGEYVIKASSVKKFGTDFFDALNEGSLSRVATRTPSVPNGFANGGQITKASQDVNINVINQSSQPVRARQEQDPRTGIIQVILEDIQRGGPVSRSINKITSTSRGIG